MFANQSNQNRITLQEYLNGRNLKLKLRSKSKSVQEKQITSSFVKAADKNISIAKLTRQELVDRLKLTVRQFIPNDVQFTKVNRIIDRISQLYQIQIEETKRDKNILETIIHENQMVAKSIRKSHAVWNQQQQPAKSSPQPRIAHLRQSLIQIQSLSSHLSKEDQQNEKYLINHVRSSRNRKTSQQVQSKSPKHNANDDPIINVLRVTRHAEKQEQETKQTIRINEKEVNAQSPTRKSVSWNNEDLPIESRVDNQTPGNTYVIETPSTLKRRTEEKRSSVGPNQSKGIKLYESFKKRRESQQVRHRN